MNLDSMQHLSQHKVGIDVYPQTTKARAASGYILKNNYVPD